MHVSVLSGANVVDSHACTCPLLAVYKLQTFVPSSNVKIWLQPLALAYISAWSATCCIIASFRSLQLCTIKSARKVSLLVFLTLLD